MTTEATHFVSPFNGPVEIGLRALCVLTAAFPLRTRCSGSSSSTTSSSTPMTSRAAPRGCIPRTPHRGGEILVRRGVLQDGLTLYESRGLVERVYKDGGIFFAATDKSADFLDTLSTEYLAGLRERADWVVDSFGALDDAELDAMVRDRIGTWGAEFAMESVLWTEEAS
jgi:hypothetical protein